MSEWMEITMTVMKKGDFTGRSNAGINEAIQDALKKAGKPQRFVVVETRCSHADDNRRYQVTLATLTS